MLPLETRKRDVESFSIGKISLSSKLAFSTGFSDHFVHVRKTWTSRFSSRLTERQIPGGSWGGSQARSAVPETLLFCFPCFPQSPSGIPHPSWARAFRPTSAFVPGEIWWKLCPQIFSVSSSVEFVSEWKRRTRSGPWRSRTQREIYLSSALLWFFRSCLPA